MPGARLFADALRPRESLRITAKIAAFFSQNADPPYGTPNVRVTAHWLKDTPIRPSNLRAPGKIANIFAVESFPVDQIAAATGMDPVAYRLQGMNDPQAIAVVKARHGVIRIAGAKISQSRACSGNHPTGPWLRLRALQREAENDAALAIEVSSGHGHRKGNTEPGGLCA